MRIQAEDAILAEHGTASAAVQAVVTAVRRHGGTKAEAESVSSEVYIF